LESQFYSISLNGDHKQRLTKAAGSHAVRLSPSFTWWTDSFSSISEPPRTTLYAKGGDKATVLAAQLALLAGAFWLALAMRVDFSWQTPAGLPWRSGLFLRLLPIVLGVKLGVWIALGLHRGAGDWRHTSLGDALRLTSGTAIGLTLLVAGSGIWQWMAASGGTPSAPGAFRMESVFILDALCSLFLIGGTRIAVRLLYEESRPVAPGGIVRLLIIGAGDAAAACLREIARMPEQRYRVVGLLDDSPAKQRARVQGARVRGSPVPYAK